MKKIIAAAVLCAFVLCSCANRSGNSASSRVQLKNIGSEESAPHERHDYEDNILLGKWEGLRYDAELSTDGFISVSSDISYLFCFDRDGRVYVDGEVLPEEDVKFDGSVITVMLDGEELVHLTRTGEPNTESKDGEYTVDNDYFKSIFVGDSEQENVKMPEIDMRLTFDGEYCKMEIKNVCSYEQHGDVLTVNGDILSYMGKENPSEYTFLLENNICKVYTDGVNFDEYEKITE